MTIESLNLKYNPFRDLSANASEPGLIWGGMDEIKGKLQKCYTEVIRTNSKQIILNWGPYGGGKTFSAFYFAHTQGQVDNLTHIYIQSPKDGAKATDDFFKSVIDKLTFEKIREQIKGIIESRGENEVLQFLIPRSTREFAKAICLIGSENEEVSGIMNRFLYSGVTLTELKKLGLAKKIQTDTDRVKFLAGIVSCFAGNDSFVNGRVVFWIDEMEDLIYFTPKYYRAFSQVLRDLFDSIPDRLLVFMNFTLAEGQENTIELILGGAMWSRINKKLRYKEFVQDDAVKYCNDLLGFAKIRKTSAKPFNMDLLKEILNNISSDNLTPREINKHISSLINYTLENNLTEINQDVFNNWMREFSEDN